MTYKLNLPVVKAWTEAATVGPWYHDDSTGQLEVWSDETNEMIVGDGAEGYIGPNAADATFIAAARTVVPALVAEVERLRIEPHEVVNAALIGLGIEREERGEILDALADSLRPDGWHTGSFDRKSSASSSTGGQL